MSSTGWTYDYVEDHIDLPRLAELTEYWRDHPPVHVMVAAYLGIKPKPKDDDPGAFIQAFLHLPGTSTR